MTRALPIAAALVGLGAVVSSTATVVDVCSAAAGGNGGCRVTHASANFDAFVITAIVLTAAVGLGVLLAWRFATRLATFVLLAGIVCWYVAWSESPGEGMPWNLWL